MLDGASSDMNGKRVGGRRVHKPPVHLIVLAVLLLIVLGTWCTPALSSSSLPASTALQGLRQHSGRSDLFRKQHRPLLGLDAPSRQHRLAVLVPYRDRFSHLINLLPALRSHLEPQNISYDVFILEQADDYVFNRGALLNAGAALLDGSAYDYFVFQDVDTIPVDPRILYTYPKGNKPVHLSPFGVHPKANYEEFFGGILLVTAQQFASVNGFGTEFWGWGREDDNFRERMRKLDLWPADTPDVPRTKKRNEYFRHQVHKRQAEVTGHLQEDKTMTYELRDPQGLMKDIVQMSSQPEILQDFHTGLNTTLFRIERVMPFMNATVFSLQLSCDTKVTPWCEPTGTKNVQRAHLQKLAVQLGLP